MPSILASAVLNKAAIIIQDTTGIRWPQSEGLGWLNDGQREIANARADACVVNKSVPLVAGTKQTLGSGTTTDAIALQKVVRNMGSGGTTPGAAIRIVSQEILDSQSPNWHTDTPAAAVKHAMHDPRAPKIWYCWPPSDGSGQVEIQYQASPTDVAAVGNVISVDDIFNNALIDYILYRYYSKNVTFAGNGERAVGHYNAFTSFLGLRGQNLTANNPNLANQAFNPNVPGAAQ